MLTLKQTQSEKGRVTRTMTQEKMVRIQPHTPIPSLSAGSVPAIYSFVEKEIIGLGCVKTIKTFKVSQMVI